LKEKPGKALRENGPGASRESEDMAGERLDLKKQRGEHDRLNQKLRGSFGVGQRNERNETIHAGQEKREK